MINISSKPKVNKNYFIIIFLFITAITFSNAHAQLMTSAAIGAVGEIVQKQFSVGKLQINKIILEEPHIIPKASINKFFAKYEGKKISVEDITEIQRRLSKYYYSKGYINSGVIVPNQRISNGVIRFRAVHGRLTRVKIKGNKRTSKAFVKSFIAKGVTVPLNSMLLQQTLEKLQRHQLISEVKAQISPGKKLGQSILELNITENEPYFVNTQISNHQSPSIGQYRLDLNFGHRDITKNLDTLDVNLGVSEGLFDTNFNYSLPWRGNGITFGATLNHSRFKIIDEAFSQADINSQSTVVGFSMNASLRKTAELDLTAGVAMDIKHMTLSMFGEPAPTDGFIEGENNSTPINLHVNAVFQKPKLAVAMFASIRRGTSINFYGKSYEEQLFTAVTGQMSVAVKPMPKLEWHIRLNGQMTRDKLLPIEKYSVGGVKSVRGYRENLLVRDNGFVASTQLRYSVLPAKLFLVPFIDYGRSWDSDQGKLGGAGEEITSIGTGLQFKATKEIYSELFWGKTLSKIHSNSDLTQDYSLHFLMRYNIL